MADEQVDLGQTVAPAVTTGGGVPSNPFLIGTSAEGGMAGLPERIGRYRVKRLIGSGGMGAVYEAVQEQPRRTVALKVMGLRMGSAAAIRRFEYEAQVMSRLRHAGIAQVYEAGTHSDPVTGVVVPYFAMEYVPAAMTLTEYATAKHLGLRERLLLFIKVCDAVQHGHHKGVIHRDLKPANILVDSTGQPKVIDFGVARATDNDQALATYETQVGQLIGTVQYMSPEQVSADPHDIDVRADVYSLGVVLYEVLSGKLPYDLSRTSLVEASRLVQQQPAPRLSTIDTALRGDVETIVLKALEKDRDRRYQTVEALAADIGRYLRNEPIEARRVGTAGRIVRWVKRNRALATAMGVAAATLFVVSSVLITQVVIARDRARANLKTAEQNLRVAEENFALVKNLFGSMRANLLSHGLVDVEQLLDRAAEKLNERPPELPASEADFREMLGQGYADMGVYAKSITNQRRVLEIRQKLYPATSPQIADSLHLLGAALWWNGEYDEAERLYKQSLQIRRDLYGPEHASIATSLTHLGACCLKQGRMEEALDHYKQALEMRRKLQGPRSPDVAASLNNLARCSKEQGDYIRAEELFRQALEMITGLAGESDLSTSHATHNLAACVLEMGRPQEAEALFSKALALRLKKLKATHPLVLSSRLGLARAKFAEEPGVGPLKEAQEALQGLETELSGDHPDVADGDVAVGEMLMTMDRAPEAEPLLRRALTITQTPKQPVPADLAEMRVRLGLCIAKQGHASGSKERLVEAKGLLLAGYEALPKGGRRTGLRAGAAKELAALYRADGEPEKAARFERAPTEESR